MDLITLQLAEDAYQGDAIVQFTVDGIRQPPVTITASHAAGASQTVMFSVPSAATHLVEAVFTNDAYASPTQDRNAYLIGLSGPMMMAGAAAMTTPGVVKLARTGDAVMFLAAGVLQVDTPFFEDTFKTLSLQSFTNDNPPAKGKPGNWRTCYHNGWPPNTSTTPPGTPGKPDVDPSARYCIGNNEGECYEDTGVQLCPTGVALIATRTPGAHFPYQAWTSGVLQQSPDFAMVHGYWEAVADVPRVQGMFPAIWLLPDGHEPPEIDMLEIYGLTSPVNQYHAGLIDKYGSPGIFQGGFSPSLFTPGFHKIGVRVDTATVEFYLDDAMWSSYPTYADFTIPFTMILNLAVGGPNCFVGQPAADCASCTMWVASARSYALPASGIWPVSGKRIPATPPVPTFS